MKKFLLGLLFLLIFVILGACSDFEAQEPYALESELLAQLELTGAGVDTAHLGDDDDSQVTLDPSNGLAINMGNSAYVITPDPE